MKVSTISVTQITTALALVAMLASETEASKKFVKMLPNGGNVPDTPAIGHSDGTGKSAATNAFGDAFAAAGYKWTKEFCQADTDGDGQTNGQELGDPCCEWDQDTNPVVLWTTGVSHPDDATKKSDPSLWAGKCGSSTSSTSSTSGAATTTAASSKESGGASSGSAATSSPSTTSAPSSASSSSTSPTSASAASNSKSHSEDHEDSSMHMHHSSHSASTAGSLSATGSRSSAVEVGSPSTSSGSSRNSIRSASSASSAKPSSSSSSSSTPTTSGASAVSPVFFAVAGAVVAATAFLA